MTLTVVRLPVDGLTDLGRTLVPSNAGFHHGTKLYQLNFSRIKTTTTITVLFFLFCRCKNSGDFKVTFIFLNRNIYFSTHYSMQLAIFYEKVLTYAC